MLPRIGDTATRAHYFRGCETNLVADLISDHNPLHLDERAARQSRFGATIVHGAHLAAMFSGLLGEELPGEGSIYLSQNSQFKTVVYHGEHISFRVTVTEVTPKPAKGFAVVKLHTEAIKDDGTVAVDGEATVLYPLEG